MKMANEVLDDLGHKVVAAVKGRITSGQCEHSIGPFTVHAAPGEEDDFTNRHCFYEVEGELHHIVAVEFNSPRCAFVYDAWGDDGDFGDDMTKLYKGTETQLAEDINAALAAL